MSGSDHFRVQVYKNEFSAAAITGALMDKGVLLAAPGPGEVHGLQFRTRLPGGFVECSFTYGADTALEAARWKWNFTSQHMEVFDEAGKVVWYGLIEDLDLDLLSDAVLVVGLGYYTTLDDVPYDTEDTTEEDFPDAVHWALSQQGLSEDWRGSFLDGGVVAVEDTGTPVQRRSGESGLESVRETIEEWTAAGDSSGGRYWPAVWASRQLEVRAEQTSTVWYCRKSQLARCTLRSTRKDIFNLVIVSFQDTLDGARKDSTPAEDTESQQRHGKRGIRYPAGELDQAAADQLAEQLLAGLKDLQDTPGIALAGTVLDSGMTERPSWYVRAGDVLEAIDLEIPSRPAGEVVTGRNRWLILETTYNADSNSLDIVPNVQKRTVETVLEDALRTVRLMAPGTGSSGGGGGGGGVAYTYWDPDAPPVTPHAMDDEFDDQSIDAKWTLWDPGGFIGSTWTATEDSFGRLGLLVPNTTSHGWAGYYQAWPGLCTVTLKGGIQNKNGATSNGPGIIIGENLSGAPSTSEFVAIYMYHTGMEERIIVVRGPNYNSAATSISDVLVSSLQSLMHIRVRVTAVGANSIDLSVDASRDGYYWRETYSGTIGSGAAPFVPAQIGIGCNQRTASGTSFDPRLVAFDHFRVIASGTTEKLLPTKGQPRA